MNGNTYNDAILVNAVEDVNLNRPLHLFGALDDDKFEQLDD